MFNWAKRKKWLLANTVLVAVLVSLLGIQVIDTGDAVDRSVKIGIGNEKVITLGHLAYAAGSVDYTYDGTDDDVQFQAALDALPATGGRIVDVSAVQKNFSATVTRAIPNVTVIGAGQGSYFTNDGITVLFTAGGNGWKFADLRTDAGSIDMGATTGWQWVYVNDGATLFDFRTPTSYIVAGGLVTNNINDTSLTAGRIPYPDVGGVLIDSSNLTFNDSTFSLQVGGANVTRSATYVVAASDAPAHVKAQADYVCDGTADDVQIQAAIDALSTGGGVVVLSRGLFTLASLLTISNSDVALYGQGWSTYLYGSLALTMIDIDHATVPVQRVSVSNLRMENVGNGAGIRLGNTTTTYEVTIKYIRFKGNNNTGQSFLQLEGTNTKTRILHNTVADVGNAINMASTNQVLIDDLIQDGGSDGVIDMSGVQNDLTISGVVADLYGVGNGLRVRDSGRNIKVINNTIRRSAVNGIQVEYVTGAIGIRGLSILNNDIELSGNYGIYICGDTGALLHKEILVAGNKIKTSTSSGIYVKYSQFVNIIGNEIYNNGQSGATAKLRSGIYLAPENEYEIDISNNQIFDDQGIVTQQYGVYDEVGVAIYNNRFLNNAVAQISSVAASKVKDNLGYVTENSGTATVLSGNTVTAVTHGLSITPEEKNISITPLSLMGNAGYLYVSDNATASYFWVVSDVDPVSANITFGWNYGNN